MDDDMRFPPAPDGNDEEENREWIRQMAAVHVRKWIEDSLWNPADLANHLLPDEMGGVPDTRLSERERPGGDFPIRAMSEEEVLVFAKGVGRMAANAWKANEEAFAKQDSDLELHYRVQAGADEKVLTLLERVLRGEWPRSDA